MTGDVDQLSHGRRSRWRLAAAGAVAAAAFVGGGAVLSAQSGGVARAEAGTTLSPSGGFSPQMLQRAYGVSPLLRRGVDGRGETVVLPEQGFTGTTGLSNIHQSLAAFDKRDHLPGVHLTVDRVFGFTGHAALAQLEEVLDAEMIHAIAPEARIRIMLSGARAFSPPDLGALMRAAAERGNIVSLSYNECERCLSAAALRSLLRALQYARDRHVSVLAAAGDFGAASGASVNRPSATRGVAAPASSPLVTAVGGTSLGVHDDGAYATESAWNDNTVPDPPNSSYRYIATGGGISARYARPGYQDGLPVIGGHRGVPDVSAMAATGLAVVLDGGTTVVLHDGHPVVQPAHEMTLADPGTSASTPLWAAIAALADQDAHRQLGFLNQGLYRIGHSGQYRRAFHDVTLGDNTVTLPSGRRITGYRTRPGWDPVTGWGSPDAQVLVPLLGRAVHATDGQGL